MRSFATFSSWSPGKPVQLFPTENNMGGDSGAKASLCTVKLANHAPSCTGHSGEAEFPVVIRRAELNVASTVFLGVS